MKVYSSVDMEGIAGISHWDEATKSQPEYEEFRELMTDEAIAACEGAIAAGASEVVLCDAHGTSRNILTKGIPEPVTVVRGFSGHPMAMVQQLDESFDAVAMIGYHSKGGSADNPLAHTITLRVAEIRINGEPASEFRIYGYASSLVGVPVAFVSGDAALCEEVRRVNGAIATLAVSRGVGDATVSMSPARATERIRSGLEAALRSDLSERQLTRPDRFEVEIAYVSATAAYRMAFYPGARQSGPRTLAFETDDYFEVLRLLMFAI